MATTPASPGRPHVREIRLGPIAGRVNLRVLALSGLAVLLIAALAAWSLTLGSFELSLAAIVGALRGDGSTDAYFVVLSLRLPRILAALVVGSMLALSGAIFQGLVRNPLVSPDIVGINAGASFTAVLWIVTGRPSALLPIVAFAGALAAAAAIYALTWRGRISPGRLILVGIGVNAVLTAGTTLAMVRYPVEQVSSAVLWMAGSLYASSWSEVGVLAAALAMLLPIGAVLMGPMQLLQLGDPTARGLGMPVELMRLGLMVIGCGLSGVAVSVAGPIGFVAFIVPHAARMLAGPMTAGVFMLTAVLGAALLLGADMIGSHALPIDLPVGVITAAVGGPYFLWLLYRVNVRL